MNICVFCSSGEGQNSLYATSAIEIGMKLASRGDTIIHGGSAGGLMGKLTEGANLHGGRVIGVTCPQVRTLEPAFDGIQEVIETESLSLRKFKMMDLADEIIILPGGFGTLDEACEIITQKQLGLVKKPISFININGYWDNFLAFIRVAEKENMIITEGRDTFRVYVSVNNYFILT